MGSRNVQRAAALMTGHVDPRYKDLPDRSRIVLLVMAAMALDYDGTKADARHYFGGWHTLAHALGFPNANRGTTGQRATARALRDLQDRGLIHHVGRAEPRPTARHVYALDL